MILHFQLENIRPINLSFHEEAIVLIKFTGIYVCLVSGGCMQILIQMNTVSKSSVTQCS